MEATLGDLFRWLPVSELRAQLFLKVRRHNGPTYLPPPAASRFRERAKHPAEILEHPGSAGFPEIRSRTCGPIYRQFRRVGPLPPPRLSKGMIAAQTRTRKETGIRPSSLRNRSMSASGGDLNRSTQHLLILPDEEVCAWMHGPGSRRSRRLSSGSAGRAVNV